MLKHWYFLIFPKNLDKSLHKHIFFLITVISISCKHNRISSFYILFHKKKRFYRDVHKKERKFEVIIEFFLTFLFYIKFLNSFKYPLFFKTIHLEFLCNLYFLICFKKLFSNHLRIFTFDNYMVR